jgi:protoheme IX farnesyltransferase
MSASPSHAEAASGVTAKSHSRTGDFITLMKPRLNFLVLLTVAAAYSLGAGPGSTLIDLVHTLLGTFLVAGGAAALNQVWERRTDRLMRRTQSRPRTFNVGRRA